MRTIELSDHLYDRVASAASERGQSVEQFVEEAVGNELGCTDEEIQARFTPEVIAMLDRSVTEAHAGNVMTPSEFEAKFQAFRRTQLGLG